MAEVKLGKVTTTPKGEWASGASYERLDIVQRNGSSWMAKRANTGIEPVEGEDWMNLVNITKDSVVDALGYTPEMDRTGKWFTLYSTQLTEEANSVAIDKDNDGNSFSVAGIIIKVLTPYPQESDWFTVSILNIKGNRIYQKALRIESQTIQNPAATSYKEQYHSSFLFRMVPLNGLFFIMAATGTQGNCMSYIEGSNADPMYVSQQKICRISMKMGHDDRVLQAGTDIIVYALRE